MILDRRAAQGQAVIGVDQPRSLVRKRAGFFNGLRFVENTIVEMHILEMNRVSRERAVGRDHEIILSKVVARFMTSGFPVVEDTQLRCKARRFFLPVKYQGAWHDYECLARRRTAGTFQL